VAIVPWNRPALGAGLGAGKKVRMALGRNSSALPRQTRHKFVRLASPWNGHILSLRRTTCFNRPVSCWLGFTWQPNASYKELAHRLRLWVQVWVQLKKKKWLPISR